MNNLIAIIPIAAGAYVATNLDNFILLVALLARYRNHTPNVVVGYFACMLILGFVGYSIGAAANIMPVEYLGLLGFVPIFIGAYELIQMRRGTAEVILDEEKAVDGVKKVFLATLMSQLSNGADTVVVLGVLFTDSNAPADILIILTLVAMAVIFVLVGIYAVRHPALSKWINRYAYRAMPFVLIIVGIYILANTVTDILPD
ncbi:MAG: cadmium resistance transporter [Proteobacteria bacterium]|nr:cadmium resistance transporter [Pseudomonadota bacterium]